MSQVYVANPTRQHREFHYRVLEVADARFLSIRAGAQEVIPGDFEGQGLEYVLRQLRTIGGVEVRDLSAMGTGQAVLFKVDRKPMSSDQINSGVEKNQKVRQDLSDEEAERAALASFQGQQNTLGAAGVDPEKVVTTSVDVVEVRDHDQAVHNSVDYETVVSKKSGGGSGKRQTGKKRQSR